MPGLNPFILKSKRKLLEGFSIGDTVEITWNASRAYSLTGVVVAKGKIVEMDDWIRLRGTAMTHIPITMLQSVRSV